MMDDATTADQLAASEAAERLIDDGQFHDLIRGRSRPLLEIACRLAAMRGGEVDLTRPLSGRLLLESDKLEEVLDEYGARHNRRWGRFRALTATLRNFARIGQALAHVQRRLPAYRLQPIASDFLAATSEHLRLAGGVVAKVAAGLVEEARGLGIGVDGLAPSPEDFSEHLPPGRLPRDRDDRIAGDPSAAIPHLATEFLNLAAESGRLRDAARVAPVDYAACFPDPVSEERLRQLAFRFHNLQSLYDTHVAGTALETADADLPTLRGHASVIYHLLGMATDLAHYYERHVRPRIGHTALSEGPVVDIDAAMATLFGYAMTYSSDYLAAGQRLSQDILRRYAEPARLDVPAPCYRGFHVRPSNLVARIVAHYGSEVRMDLDGELFDAGSPLALFRANETINARKRRWLAAQIARVAPKRDGALAAAAIEAAVLAIVHRLAGEGKIVLYRQPLELSDQIGRRGGGVLENTVAEIAGLQATGQMDIRTDLTVTFIGDRRVLADLDTLARHGYGEDNFGNNVLLPPELAYLRR